MKCSRLAKPFLLMAGIGLVITVALNLYGLLMLDKSSAVFFSAAWWPTWLPAYSVWLSFMLVGLVLLLTPSSKR